MAVKGSTKVVSNQREQGFDAFYPGVCQKVAVGAASAQSAALGAGTTLVRLFSTVDCYIQIALAPTALSDGTSMFLPGGIVEYVGVAIAGSKIANIAAGASLGTLYIAEGG